MLPRVILYNAVSAYGRIDWFTADIGLHYQLASRWREDATLAGSDTLLGSGDEILDGDETTSPPPPPDAKDGRPLLAVPDSRGRIRTWHYWQSQPYRHDVVVLCSRSTPEDYIDYLKKRHIDYVVAGDDQVNLRRGLQELNSCYGVETVRVDSSGTLNWMLLRAGLVDEVSLLIHPSIVGRVTPRSLFRAPDLSSPGGIIQLKLAHFEKLEGDIICLRFQIVKSSLSAPLIFPRAYRRIETLLGGPLAQLVRAQS